MDQPAQRIDEAPVPPVGQILVRALSATAVMAIGLPLTTVWVLGASGDGGPWWGWLLILAVIVGLSAIVQRCASLPRPRVDQHIGQAQWASATATIANTGELPAYPEVRIAVGVAACASIKGVIGLVSFLVATAVSVMLLPDLWTALVPVTAMTGMTAFRARRGWAYLRALHTAERTN